MNQTIQLPSDETVLSLDSEVSIRHLYISPGHNFFGPRDGTRHESDH